MSDPDWWKDHAACRGADPAHFYPDFYPPQPQLDWVRANYCDPCPVRSRCATYAMEHDEMHGIWAGQFLGGSRPHRSAANKIARRRLLTVVSEWRDAAPVQV